MAVACDGRKDQFSEVIEIYFREVQSDGGVARGSLMFPRQEAATAKDKASVEEPRLIVAGSDPNVYLNEVPAVTQVCWRVSAEFFTFSQPYLSSCMMFHPSIVLLESISIHATGLPTHIKHKQNFLYC